MNLKKLKQMVDRYGMEKAKLEVLEGIKGWIEEGLIDNNIDEVEGKFYRAKRYDHSTKKDIEPVQAFEILEENIEEFMEVVKIVKTELKKKIGDDLVDKLSPILSVDKRIKITPVAN